MSRQQFLAELTQYLTFVTPAEREAIIGAFDTRFDSAGAEGESALIMELGTPMAIAIALKRRREAGELIIPGATASPGAPSETESDTSDTPDRAYSPDGTAAPLPVEYEPSGLDPMTAQAAPAPSEEGGGAEVFDQSDELNVLPESDIMYGQASDIPGIGSQGAAPNIEREAPAPRRSLSAGLIIGASLLSVVIAVFFAALGAAGAYLLIVAGTFLVAALQTLSTVPEALWMFMYGFGAGAAGLLVLWFSLWSAISLIRRLFGGPSAKHSVFRSRMKKIWLVIWIIFAVLAIAAAVCAFLGTRGDTADLEHPKVASLIDWVYKNPVVDYIRGLLGISQK